MRSVGRSLGAGVALALLGCLGACQTYPPIHADAAADVRAADATADGAPDRSLAKDASPCAKNPCLNGGSCTPSASGFTCACPSWAMGPTCAILTDGKARFQVLTPTLIRMEYAEDGAFEERASINVIHRDLPVPHYTTTLASGWREIDTGAILVRYKQKSGPFTSSNLIARVLVDGEAKTVNPWVATRPAPCKFGLSCEAEAARLSGTVVASDHQGASGGSFAAGLTAPGTSILWFVDEVPSSGDYSLWVRYSNGPILATTRTLSLYVNGQKSQLMLEPTRSWDAWNTLQIVVPLRGGSNALALSFDQGDSGNVNIDWIAATPRRQQTPPAPTPAPALPTNLGGWTRGLDGCGGCSFPISSCSGTPQLHDGLLSREGWYLLDDTATALYQADGKPAARSRGLSAYQDGYFFGYGLDYQTALSDFYRVTGNPPLLPRWAFGIWFSRRHAYSDTDLKKLVAEFRSNQVPLDVLPVDTDWKEPYSWNGWDWSKKLFPDPNAFLKWAQQQGIVVALNIHPSIQQSDEPHYSQAKATAGGSLVGLPLPCAGNPLNPLDGCFSWDWAKDSHLRSYFDLHTPFESQGIRLFWLDWCCEGPPPQLAGLPGDTWINSLYAKRSTDRGERGFAFSHIGSGYEGYGSMGRPGTAWADHRYTLHFTGDTCPSWEMLSYESYYTIREASIGLPYVTHDIGSHNASDTDLLDPSTCLKPPPFCWPRLDPELYLRWVQFGVFQPVLRLHSNEGLRLPWEYAKDHPEIAAQAARFLRLREALVPYTYSLARESSTGGLPMVRGMYFAYPQRDEAYAYDRQYLFGDHILVAPIASAGPAASTKVWFPPGVWTSFFTGEVVTGPTVKSISAGYDSMPVFVRAGGIVPMQPYMDHVGAKPVDPLLLQVYVGADGQFALYEDEGENLNHLSGAYSVTPIAYLEATRQLTIRARQGTFAGALAQRRYEITFVGAKRPAFVMVGSSLLAEIAPGGSQQGFWLDSSGVHVKVEAHSTTSDLAVQLF